MTEVIDDSVHAMMSAINEIHRLRRANEVLQAKVDTMNLLGDMLRTTIVRQGQIDQPDPVWMLQRGIDHLTRAPHDPTAARKG